MSARTWWAVAALLAAASFAFGYFVPEVAGGLYGVLVWFSCERSGGLWGCGGEPGFAFYASRAFVAENAILTAWLFSKWRRA